MANYSINRGVGKSVEFKGLKAQYLYILGGGLFGLFLLFTFMQMLRVPNIFTIPFTILSVAVLVWSLFWINAKYGEYGVMKLMARMSHPRYIINRKTINKLIQCDKF